MAREFDPHKLSSPRVYLFSMLIFVALVAFLVLILNRQIFENFSTNPGLNGLILGVLLVGMILAFLQVIRLMPEVAWVNSFRRGKADERRRKPVLLAPMEAMLGGKSDVALSTGSTQSILDSIGNRLDERREISRYLISLLVIGKALRLRSKVALFKGLLAERIPHLAEIADGVGDAPEIGMHSC